MPYCKTNPARFSTLHSIWPPEVFWEKNRFFQQFKLFSSFLLSEQNAPSVLMKKTLNDCQNSMLRVLEINFLDKLKRKEKSTDIQISGTYSKKELKKSFRQTCQKFTCVVHSNILRKASFWNFLFFFLGFWVFILCPKEEKTQSGRRNFLLRVGENFFGEKLFFVFWISLIFLDFERNFQRTLVQKAKKKLSKQHSKCPEDQFSSKKTWKILKRLGFSSSQPKTVCQKKLWQICQKCIWFICRNFLRKTSFIETFLFFFLGFSVYILCLLAKQSVHGCQNIFYVSA